MTDAELVARLKTYDDEAYREVVARYSDSLYGYIYSITGNQHVSEDVLSETYLRMIEKIDSYRFYGAPFKAWLYRIAHNVAINHVKQAHRHAGSVTLDITAPAIHEPETAVTMRVEAEELRAALSELTDEQQQVVLLRFVAGQSSGEVARTLEKSENAVKQMQFRALRSLGRLLDRQK